MIRVHRPNFSAVSILVIGDTMLDRYWFGDTARISPEAPVPIVKINQTNERPGGAGNVALNIAALGAKVNLIGVTGDDAAAQQLEHQLSLAGVSHTLLRVPDMPTITKLRIISRHQQLIRLDFEETFPPLDADALLHAYQKPLMTASAVIISDYQKGTLNCTNKLISLAKEIGVPVIIDPKGHDVSCYRGADIITPNLKEFEALVGYCRSENEMTEKALGLLKEYDIGALLLTRGEAGMTLIEQDGKKTHLPAHARDVFDVTGAGDTVIAVLGAAIASGSCYAEAMYLANMAAGLVVAKLGTATVTTAELDVALQGVVQAHSRVVTEDELFSRVTDVHLKGKKIVFTNGCFDILHAGHVTYLQQAKQLGDYLIVAVNDDASVRRAKGPLRPINTLEQRMAVLAGLGVVDWVIPFSEDTPEPLLKRLQPDILVKGGDYRPDQVVGKEIVLAYGGEVRVLGVIAGVSTSSIIDRVINHNHPFSQAP